MTDVQCVCRRWVRQHKPVVEVSGTIGDDMEFPVKVIVWAASPMDRNQSYSGSGLPFASPEMAFSNNSVVLDNYQNSDFKVLLLEPNAFYDEGGSVYVPPTVFVRVVSKRNPKQTAYSYHTLSQVAAPYRALNDVAMPLNVRERTGPAFYGGRNRLPVRTQYEILVDSAYPCENEMLRNFWGLKPPQ